jgi:hypothetical protein
VTVAEVVRDPTRDGWDVTLGDGRRVFVTVVDLVSASVKSTDDAVILAVGLRKIIHQRSLGDLPESEVVRSQVSRSLIDPEVMKRIDRSNDSRAAMIAELRDAGIVDGRSLLKSLRES